MTKPAMNFSPKERVNAAIERTPLDRVPTQFRAEPEVYSRIRQARGMDSDEAVREWALSDIRDLGSIMTEGGYGPYTGFGWKDRVMPDGTQEDFWQVRRTRVSYDGGSYIDICHNPLKDASPHEVRNFEWPDPRRIFDFSPLPAMVREFDKGRRLWYMVEVESVFDRCWAFRGMEQFLADLLLEPELAGFMLEKMALFFEQRTHMILKAAGGCLDGAGFFNDLGTQRAMLVAPELYRRFVKPWERRLAEIVKSYGLKIFYHSCGAVEPVYDDFIDIGVDIVDPLQLRAMEVSAEHVKQRYGPRITFHGGLDTQGF
ncbi:MAG: hypothetical protein E4H36_04355, partial [Spirochaetales bacterium]